MTKLRLTSTAHSIFTKLPPEAKSLIKKSLSEIAASPYSGKPLQGELTGYLSFRTKRYRIIYRVNDFDRAIEVIHIGHRSGVYEQLEAMLRRSDKA